MTFADIIGILAMICSLCLSVGMILQIRKIVKRKSSKDISLILYCIVITGYLLWLLRGIAINDIYLIITDIVGLTLSSILLIFILKYR